MLSTLPPGVLATFGALVLAMLALWAPRLSTAPSARSWWVWPFAVAVLLAQGVDLVDTPALVAMFALVTACRFSHLAADGPLKGFALAVMLALSAALLLHAVPGFNNPKVLDGVRLSADALPYTKFLNFDKGVLGLFLLGLYAPERTWRPSPPGAWAMAAPRFALMAMAVMAATLAAGYAHWDPKLPAWWPLWLTSMVFLTALPEEAVFRHVVQSGLASWLGSTERARWTALVASAVLFGLAHIGGGWVYVGLATLAGLGYGLVYAITGSIVAAIAAHSALNLLHLLLFTYPALQTSGG